MYKYTFRLPSYKLWEYELDLAKREIQALVSPDAQLVLTLDGFQIEQVFPIDRNKLKELCFCHCVIVASENQNEVIDTQQAISESSTKIADSVKNFAELQRKMQANTLILKGGKHRHMGSTVYTHIRGSFIHS